MSGLGFGILHCIFSFLISYSLLILLFDFFCICFEYNLFTIVNMMYFCSIKILLPIQRKKRNLDGFTEDLKAYILSRDLALFESGLCCWV